MANNAQTLAAAKEYTDARVLEHVQAEDPHPQYAQIVDGAGEPTGGRIFALLAGQPLPAVERGSIVLSPGPSPASGIYAPNEAADAWVLMALGPIPADTTAPTMPANFRAASTTTSSVTLAWNASTDTESGVAGYDVAIDGGAFTSIGNVLTHTYTGLAAGSSHSFRVRARDNATTPNVSAAATLTASTMSAPVTTPQNVRTTAIAQTSITWAWDAPPSTPAGATLIRYEWRLAGGTFATNGTALTKQVTGLTASTNYTFGVRAAFSDGSFSTEATLASRTANSATAVVTMMGVSHTPTSTHGGLTWDGWRSYNLSALNNDATKTPKPKFVAWSESGSPLSGTNYTTTFNHVRSVLDTFYYGGTGQTMNQNASIKLYWSNGNENYSTTKIPNVANFVTSMRALYDGCHYIDPATGQRRYPNAYAGSNPTTFHEQSGLVQTPLHASAQYHDFVMWSMYPPDLGDPGQAVTFNWPSLREVDRTNADLGYLVRCFYRVKQAEAQARIDRGDPSFRLAIGCGETGATAHPTDSTLRPYWAVHAMAGGAAKLAIQYDLDMPFLCWWDDDVAGRATAFSHDAAGTNPSTARAWHDWQQYNHEFGGTHPATWAGNPKSTWNTTGPVV